ncbi:MAG: sigma-70 family RNA polymerase sigma factor [Myxococcales bacterium]|nr:sigma-70 family RNA polymerase sigma factor [Myxococcales bacterium]
MSAMTARLAMRSYASSGVPVDPEQREAERRRRLVEEHAALVKRVARRILRRIPDQSNLIEEGDLFNVGIVGLLEARERWEDRPGGDFARFAEFRIKGAMLDELRKRDFFPRRLRAQANKLKRIQTRLIGRLGREPSDEELAEEMEVPLDELLDLKDKVTPYSFVDAQDAALALESSAAAPSRRMEHGEQNSLLLAALKNLPERQQLILDLYFNQDLRLCDIAEVLDLTVGRVSQLKTAAIEALKQDIAKQQ